MSDPIIPDGLKLYEGWNGRPVFVNTSETYKLLRSVDLQEMGNLLAKFREIQMKWLSDFMMAEMDIMNISGHRVITGLHGNVGYSKDVNFSYYMCKLINVMRAPESAWNLLTAAGMPASRHPSFMIQHADVDLQKRFMKEFLGEDVTKLSEHFKNTHSDVFCYSRLEILLASSIDSDGFIAAVAECAELERQVRSRESQDGSATKNWVKTAIPDAFLFWLTQEGLLLRPIRPRVFVADTRGIEFVLMSDDVTKMWKASYDVFAATREWARTAIAEGKNNKKAIQWERNLLFAFLITVSSSTIRDGRDISEPLFQDFFAAVDHQIDSRIIPDQLSVIFRAMRDLVPEAAPVPLMKSNRRKKGSGPLDEFKWTQMTYSAESKSFPRDFEGAYAPAPNIISWATLFNDCLQKLETKYSGSMHSTMQLFLIWLIVSGNQSSNVRELSRSDINDGSDVKNSACFRAFLIRRGTANEGVTSHLSRLATAFDYQIDELNEPIVNPVVMRFDALKNPIRRGKTPRRALGRDMLDYMREFNARDDFAFSHSRPSHYRTIFDRESGRYEQVWFPGIARIIDLLLRLPLRGFQARYLDSGEGDEFVPDLSSPQFEMVHNPSALATKGRRQGVLTVIQSLQAEPLLGLYINTNKTSLDREAGYEIPWCEDRLRDSILAMLAWQQRWNPLAVPVMCTEKTRPPLNPDVAAAITTTYPLFRDPKEPGGWPISRDVIYQYWDDICAAVEDDLAAVREGEVRIRLTDWVTEQKGGKKTWERRVARYDIHTLRVSGISALIEAGMPPDLVRQVAGHATIVMTLYYNVISAAKLNEHLKAALLRVTVDMDAMDGLADEDFDRVSEFLMNTRSPDDACGMTMLKERIGHGAGDFDVMSHGICPGGNCSSGGTWTNQAVGHIGLPRPLACSLCRYRLTGPMFLPGLVLNVNRLLHELRRKGQEIAKLNGELQTIDRQSKRAHVLRGQIEALYRETDIISEEWAAEVQYVYLAKDMLGKFIEAEKDFGNPTGDDLNLPALVTGMQSVEAQAKLESHSDFALLQTLSEGTQSWFGFQPNPALTDHREFLNEVLAANSMDPFLLRLSGKERDIAANLLGRAIVEFVPDEQIENLRDGSVLLSDFAGVADALHVLKDEVLGQGSHFDSLKVERAQRDGA